MWPPHGSCLVCSLALRGRPDHICILGTTVGTWDFGWTDTSHVHRGSGNIHSSITEMSIIHYAETLEHTSLRKAKWHLSVAYEGLLIYTWSLNPRLDAVGVNGIPQL